MSHRERSLGQKGGLSVSQWLSVPPFYGRQAKSGFWYIQGSSLRLVPWLHSQKLEDFDPPKGLAPVQTRVPPKNSLSMHIIFCQNKSLMALSQSPNFRDSCYMCLSVASLFPVPLCVSPPDFLDDPYLTFHIPSAWCLGNNSEVPFGPGPAPIFKSLRTKTLITF